MSRIAEALRAYGEPSGLRLPCVGAKYHSPTPLVVEMVDIADDEIPVPLCGTCKGNLQVFMSLMKASDGNLDWEVRREFGNRLRLLGLRAWRAGMKHG